MSEEFDWELTAKLFTEIIDKPKLVEKYLKRPPFRFLHDVFSAVHKKTKFGINHFTEFDLNHENIKEKDQKIAFLEKVINYLIFVNNEPLDVKPSKIVAGLEAEKTNNMLLAMHKCVAANTDFEAIAIKLNGGQPETEQPQVPEKKQKKEKPKKEEPVEEPVRKEKPREKKEEPKHEQPKSRNEEPEPHVEKHDDIVDDGLRPTTAKTKPARKKNKDNFDKIVVEEKSMPAGIIMDNEEDDNEDEKHTSFDHSVVANKNINADQINKKQHGYMVRDILENKNDDEGEPQNNKAEEKKKDEPKIRMGRIGNKKKDEVKTNQGSTSNNTQ